MDSESNANVGKIAHYNFSWPLNADEALLDENARLSESASILQKAKLFGIVDSDTTESTEKLTDFRKKTYDQQLNFLKDILKDENILMFGLTEISIRESPSSHAYFTDNLANVNRSTVKPPIDEVERINYGVSKMINYLNTEPTNDAQGPPSEDLVTDISVVDGNVYTGNSIAGQIKAKYCIMYDNILHKDFAYGEGIGLIVQKDLVDKFFNWNTNSRGLLEKSNNRYSVENANQKLNFWSTDCGYTLENKGLFKDKSKDGSEGNGLDLGRPFIMTAGTKNDNILRIFVNFHGVNIFNLYTETTGKDGKPVYRQLKQLEDTDDGNKTINGCIEKIKNSIVDSINEGLKKIVNKEIGKEVDKCQIFLTCDSNDSRKGVYEKITGEGFAIQFDDKSFDKSFNKSFNVKFNYDETPPLACCANHDSLEKTKRKLKYANDDEDFNGVGFLNDRKFKIDKSKKIITASNDPANDIYPSEFINPNFYGYTGDYAMFGESVASESEASESEASESEKKLSVEKEDDRFNYSEYTKNADVDGSDIKKIPLSDHQYIVSKIPMDKINVKVENVTDELGLVVPKASFKNVKEIADKAAEAPKSTPSRKRMPEKKNVTKSKSSPEKVFQEKNNEIKRTSRKGKKKRMKDLVSYDKHIKKQGETRLKNIGDVRGLFNDLGRKTKRGGRKTKRGGRKTKRVATRKKM